MEKLEIETSDLELKLDELKIDDDLWISENKLYVHVIYHFYCADGYFAALGMYRLFKALSYKLNLKFYSDYDRFTNVDIKMKFYIK